jgi:hypothetical protein
VEEAAAMAMAGEHLRGRFLLQMFLSSSFQNGFAQNTTRSRERDAGEQL